MKPLMTKPFEALINQVFFEKSTSAFAVIGADTRFVSVNPAFCRLMGYPRRELLEKTIRDITHPQDWGESADLIHRLKLKGCGITRFKKRYLRKTGEIIFGEVSASLFLHGSRKEPVLLAEIADVTARERAEVSLFNSEMKYRKLHDSMMDAFVSVGMDGRILDFNQLYQEMLGYSRKELLALTYLDLTPSKWQAMEDRIVKKQVLKRGYSDVYEKEYRRKDGRIMPVELRTVLLRDDAGAPVAMWAMVRNIGERMRAAKSLWRAKEELERKVRERTKRLKRLAEKLSHAEQEERRRIAHVLHEDLQQRLVAMQYQMQALRKNAPEKEGVKTLDRVLVELEQAIRLTRTLSADICPPVLYDFGLKAAMEWLAGNLKSRLGLVIKIEFGDVPELHSEDLRVFAFNAVRELLLNVVKHAGVDRVSIRVGPAGPGQIDIRVTDKGVGFDMDDELTEKTKFGLFSIQERAESFGGNFEIFSVPGKGVCAALTLPTQ